MKFKNRYKWFNVALILNLLWISIDFGFSIPEAQAAATSNITFSSSENITTTSVNNIYKVYLNTFRPATKIFFKVNFNNTETMTVVNDSQEVILPPGSALQFSLISGNVLTKTSIPLPIREIKAKNGQVLVQFYSAPDDFPTLSLTGDTSLIAKHEILSTPVVTDGTYAIASSGTDVKFFIKSPNNLIGFRKLADGQVAEGFGGTPVYAYLEQQDFGVSATSPGIWRLLDSNFQVVQRINQVKTKFGMQLPEGHGITISKYGNPIIITAVTRNVDSSWLTRRYNLPILDCDISEIKDGVAIREFSFWDWAVANPKISEPILDSMQLFNDPQNPSSSPIDICHANSLQYSSVDDSYLISMRSPSLLMILDTNLKTVKQVVRTDNSLQHFARYVNKTHITALGNFTFDKVSKFLDFKLVNGKWNLTEIPFPVHVSYCGNTQYLDSTHIWLGGGCGPFIPGTLGAIFKVTNGTMSLVGSLKMANFNYSYRADLVP